MNTRRLLLLIPPIVLLLIIGIWAVIEQGTPRISAVSPAPGAAAVPRGEPLKITFSRPMQADAVTSRFSAKPARDGAFSWVGNTLIFTPEQPWPIGEVVTVTLKAGARAAGWLPLAAAEQSWTFHTGKPLLAYLWPSDGPADIYALDPTSGKIDRLTSVKSVNDFDASLDGRSIYFSALNARGGSNLYRLNRLDGTTQTILECGISTCQSVQVSPKENFLAYERMPAIGEAAPFQVWLLPLAGGEPVPAGDRTHITRQPSWSMDGAAPRLAIYDATRQGYLLLNPYGGEPLFFANQTGGLGAWTPDGKNYLAPEITYIPIPGLEPLATSHLLRFDLATSQTMDLTQADDLEDVAPAYSPDGSHIAFARRYLDLARWTLGRQLWVMHADGSEATRLTNAPFYGYYDFAWSYDNQQVALVRSNQTFPTDPLELWLVNADGSNPILLILGGYTPQWIP